MIVHHETKRKIHNQHEWDPLEEVVVGRWVPGTFQAPPMMDDDAKMMKQQFPYIPDAAWPYLKQFQGTILPPQDDDRYHQEQEYLVQQLQARGIRVLRPDPTTFPIVATTQCYARDPIIVIGDKLIVTNLQFEGRRQETGNYTRLALELAKHYQGEVIMMPPNQVGYHADNAYLEGGDVFVDGTHIYVGMSGNATNDKGLEWLRTTLGDYYTVHKIALHQHVLHLDCAVMLINDHQGIICKEDFVDFEALPDRFKNRQWVEVEPAQAQLMATNGIVLDPSTVMLIDHFPNVIEKVRAMGIEVIEIPFDKSNYFGGGLRCSYQPITRS